MSNSYAFDFLRTEHTLTEEGQPKGASAVDVPAPQAEPLYNHPTDEEQMRQLAASVAHKPDLEKQFDVIHFLQAHRSAGCLPPNVIYRATGIDLEEADESVATMLQRNPKIRLELIPDPENPSVQLATYAYQAKYNNVRDPKTLLAQINRCKNGVPMRDLVDAYDGVENDLKQLITAGDVLAINNSEDKDKILFPRGEAFLVELDGIVSLKDNSTNNCVVQTDIDPRKQIRRGEAIHVAGQWFRVSSAVKEGVSLEEQPVRAQAPLSVVSLVELSKRNEQDGYIRPLSQTQIPLDAPLAPNGLHNLQESKLARDKLHKLAHNINGARSGMSTAAQLLSSNAHASNPTTLAQSFAATHHDGSSRKRPNLPKRDGTDVVSRLSADKRREAAAAQQQAASNPSLGLFSHARRHGCTKDVRDMYLALRQPIPESDPELQNLLEKHGLLDQGEILRRPRLAKRANVDNDGKPKKRRYYERKNQRMTNTHLEGTEIGIVLRQAQEMQRQGKSVGDGGM